MRTSYRVGFTATLGVPACQIWPVCIATVEMPHIGQAHGGGGLGEHVAMCTRKHLPTQWEYIQVNTTISTHAPIVLYYSTCNYMVHTCIDHCIDLHIICGTA